MTEKNKKKNIDRRSFLNTLGASAITLAGAGLLSKSTESKAQEVPVFDDRVERGHILRDRSAARAYRIKWNHYPNNREEKDYPYIANYTKGLPHDTTLGEVIPSDYKKYLKALKTANFKILENINVGIRGLKNPQSGLAFDLEGPDPQQLRMRVAPRIDRPQNSAEMVELYWMSHLRDVQFTSYNTDPLASAACADLNTMSDFRGPKVGGLVTPQTLFKGNAFGCTTGPHVSQYLLRNVSYGSLDVTQKQRRFTTGIDYMTNFSDWLFVQNGQKYPTDQPWDPTKRYIQTGRDLASYVYQDVLFQAYFNACLIMLDDDVLFDNGNPYHSLVSTCPFATFGPAHVQTLVAEVANRAVKAVFFQKWFVHRRARPEEFGGRVNAHVNGSANYPIDSEVLNSQALIQNFSLHGNYFLPQAFRIGSPTHPAYGAGHAAVAGACVTILKAFFNESFPIFNPVVPDATGNTLVPYTGSGAGSMTVGGELNKLAANISIGRNFAGIHWRTDFSEAAKLGERVAIRLLIQQARTYPEKHKFHLTKFNGKKVTINGRGYIKV